MSNPKTVQNVAENITKNEPEQVEPEAIEQFQLIPEMHADKKTKALAKKFGIDIDLLEQIPLRINEYVKENEKFKIAVAKHLEDLQPLIKVSQQLAQRQQIQPQQPIQQMGSNQGQAGLLQALLPLMGQFMGQQDNGFAELGKKALLSQINMATAITNAVVGKIASKATSEVAESIV